MQIRLGRTGLMANKDGFGTLPLQRASAEDASRILQKALDAGINFFDTARTYADSEEKIGAALAHRRNECILATKTMAKTADAFWKDLDASLRRLQTDRIDVYQFHNPETCPRPEDGIGLYEAMQLAKNQGKIRFIGITGSSLPLMREAAESGLYDTVQYPFCYLSDEKDIELTRLCAEKDIAFIGVNPPGGLLTDAGAARGWLAAYENALSLWGIQRMEELDEIIGLMDGTAVLSEEQQARIEKDRAALSGEFRVLPENNGI
jgi:aryl-alcohol dehydrogenase-like predicted oxidoreductase